jgi:hypothetical protein
VIWGFHEVQYKSASLMLDPGRLAIRAAKFEPEADRVIWTVSETYESGISDVEKNEGPLRGQ